MAISRNILDSGATSTNTSSYSTISVSPAANQLLVLMISVSNNTDINIPTCSGLAVAWTRVSGAEVHISDGSTRRRTSVFVAFGGAVPVPGTVTVDYGGQNQAGAGFTLVEVNNAYISGTPADAIRQSKVSSATSGTSISINLDSASLAANLLLVLASISANEAIANRVSWTEFMDSGYNTPVSRVEAQSLIGSDTAISASWTTSVMNLISGVEVYEVSSFPAGGNPFFTQLDAAYV